MNTTSIRSKKGLAVLINLILVLGLLFPAGANVTAQEITPPEATPEITEALAATEEAPAAAPEATETVEVTEIPAPTEETLAPTEETPAAAETDAPLETEVAPVPAAAAITVISELAPFLSQPGTPSEFQTYTVSGAGLTAGIVVSAPDGFEVSTDGVEFSPSLALPNSGGSVEPTTVAVRMIGASIGEASGFISHASEGATQVDVSVTGVVEGPLMRVANAEVAAAAATAAISFTGQELLGKPTDSSIAVNIVPDEAITYYYEYGSASGVYSDQTAHVTAAADQPSETVISGLSADTKYYYRMQYSTDAGATWLARDEHSFWTQRAAGNSFRFDVTSDTHATFNSAFQQAMTNVNSDDPDFLVDIGDTFYPGTVSSQSAVDAKYLAYRNSLYFGAIGPSVPIFLSPGNHEDEEGWNLDDTPFSVAVGSIQARKAFFPTPIDDGFYSGNTNTLPAIDEATYGNEYREDYYAWTWGDALFIVIDPFQYTMANPYGSTAGEGSDDPRSGDQWNWTLGETQYNWLKSTLENSDAKFKFVFSHQMVGGIPRDISVNTAGYVRGGAEAADYFEWGGKNADGSWGFDTKRPGWAMPIHQLFVANGVSAYFHGHDHQYVYETRDGVVYQEVPSPTMSGSGFSGIYTEGDHGAYNTVKMMPSTGHLRITVDSDQATVDYVRSGSGDSYSYVITPAAGVNHTLTLAVDPPGSGTTSPSEGDHSYPDGTPVDITAAPATGFNFDHWSGDCSGTGACAVTMDADKSVTAHFVASAGGAVTLDGAVSSNKVGTGNVLTFDHTTGTGTNRLMLVGVAWNSGTSNPAAAISSVTFTYGSTVLNLTQKIVQESLSTTKRYSAIWYSPTEPPQNTAGTITINFSASVTNGIMAGAANFAGVNQTTPLGTAAGANSSSTGTAATVTLTGLNGNELVFDNLFQGASSSSQTLAAGADQTRLWYPDYVANIRSAASTEQAAGSSVTMSWTAGSASVWAITAVPINPAPAGTIYNLTTAVDPAGSGTTSPAVGAHPYASGQIVNVTASANAGYVFSNWTGACTGSGACQVTMDADKSVTAHFVAAPTFVLTTAVSPTGAGTVNPAAGPHTYNQNDVVAVTATAAAGYRFSSWSGACTGSGACSVTMDANKSVTANFTEIPAGTVTLDGTVSSATGAANATSVAFSHTTGTGANRLLLVGVSWNGNNDTRTISSVTFTYGSNVLNLSQKIVQETASTARRFAAIWYSPTEPPQNTAGTVTITFSGAVGNGIVAGAANFAGVNQAAPFTISGGANSSSTGSTQTVTLTGLTGNELVFDTTFIGAQTPPDPTVDPSQTRLWTGTVSNTRGVASTEQATGSSVTMSWTTSSAIVWAIAAAAINPATGGPTCYALTLSHTGQGSDPVASPVKSDTCPANGQYLAGATINLSGAAPAANYHISGWTGTSNNSSTASTNTLTMPASNHAASVVYTSTEITFTGSELLGRPTDTSISISVVPDANATLMYQYGTTSGGPYTNSSPATATAGQPSVTTITGLTANTKYYYRLRYSTDGGSTWVNRPEHSFYTQRAAGSTYSFTVSSDGHVNIMLGSSSTWTNTLNDIRADNADFEIDLGDTVAMDNGSTSVAVGDTAAAEQKYKDALPFFNIVSASSPIFLVPGNHEQQEAWHLQAPLSGSLPVIGKNAEKKFFLNPVPNSFYTGDTGTYSYLSGDQKRQTYYAWTWGDALFVVINPYWFTTTKPYTTTVGGGETDATGSGDRWDWTLGQEQFNWLKTTLQNSQAKYKFIFSHQIVGSNGLSNPDQVNYGHGGVDSANLVEWGGYNVGGTTWGWDTERPGWGSQTIHQMMVANGVSAFFHGHDHQYAYEKLDGIVYQSLPSASFANGFNIYSTGGNGGKTIQAMTGPGHLRVTVGPSQTTVDYIRTSETSSAYTYTITPAVPTYTLTIVKSGAGSGTVTSSPSGINCGSTCSIPFPQGSSVTLSAAGTDGYSRLSGWSGAGCSGSGTCAVNLTANLTVTASFEKSTFADVPFTHPLYDYIQALYAAGFTSGCQAEGEPLAYCPDATMIRSESGVFMLRALSGSTYTPPTLFDTFTNEDWSGISWARKWAEGMFDEGLTAGCQYPASDPMRFCPYDLFTREQGAVFGLRIKYGKDYTPPAASGTVFTDLTDPAYWSTKWMEKAYADGLLLRCDTDGGKPAICPADDLDRSWAAYMIALAKDLID